MKYALKAGALFVLVAQVAGCGSGATLTGLAVTPQQGFGVVPNGPQQFKAVGTFSDGSQSSAIPGLQWKSDTPGVSPIDPNTGLASCTIAGNATITATAPAGGMGMSVSGMAAMRCMPGM